MKQLKDLMLWYHYVVLTALNTVSKHSMVSQHVNIDMWGEQVSNATGERKFQNKVKEGQIR